MWITSKCLEAKKIVLEMRGCAQSAQGVYIRCVYAVLKRSMHGCMVNTYKDFRDFWVYVRKHKNVSNFRALEIKTILRGLQLIK